MEIKDLTKKILQGKIFIYPTDTIYGLGCSALDRKAIKKIREMKQRPYTPFSVIAPSKKWIEETCYLSKEAKRWLKNLPGPYTLILKTKNSPVAPEVNMGIETLGIRIPDHWISSFVEELGIPIITTSVNVTDEQFMTKIEDLDADVNSEIKKRLDFVIYEGEKNGRPSRIVHLEGKEVKIRER